MAEPRRGAPGRPVEPWVPPGIGVGDVAIAAGNALADAVNPFPGMYWLGRQITDPVEAAASGIYGAAKQEITGERPQAAPGQAPPVEPPSAASWAAPVRTAPALTPEQEAELRRRELARQAELVTTGSSTTTQSAALSPAQAAEIQRESDRLGAMRVAAISEGQRRSDALATQRTELADRIASSHDALARRLGDRSNAATSRLATLEAQLRDQRSGLRADQWQPLAEMSRVDQATLAIVAALESGTASLLGRPSKAADIVERATRQSWDRYRDQIAKRMKDLDLTREDRDRMDARLQQLEAGTRAAAMDAAQARLADLAARSGDVARQLDAANAAIAIGERSIALKRQLAEASRPRSSTVSQRVPRGILEAQQAKANKPSADAEKRLQAGLAGLQRAQSLREMWIRDRPYEAAGELAKGSKSSQYISEARLARAAIAKAAFGGQLSDSEKADITSIPMGIQIRPGGESYNSGLEKIGLVEQSSARIMASAIHANPQLIGQVPPAQRPAVLQQLRLLQQPSHVAPGWTKR